MLTQPCTHKKNRIITATVISWWRKRSFVESNHSGS